MEKLKIRDLKPIVGRILHVAILYPGEGLIELLVDWLRDALLNPGPSFSRILKAIYECGYSYAFVGKLDLLCPIVKEMKSICSSTNHALLLDCFQALNSIVSAAVSIEALGEYVPFNVLWEDLGHVESTKEFSNHEGDFFDAVLDFFVDLPFKPSGELHLISLQTTVLLSLITRSDSLSDLMDSLINELLDAEESDFNITLTCIEAFRIIGAQ